MKTSRRARGRLPQVKFRAALIVAAIWKIKKVLFAFSSLFFFFERKKRGEEEEKGRRKRKRKKKKKIVVIFVFYI